MRNAIVAIVFFLTLSCAVWAKDPQSASGLPVPRFVSLKSGDVNMRSGPGTRYPILWVYHHEGWPVEIIEEFDQWRKIRDMEGTAGWVHKSMLDGHRTVIIKGKEPRTLRAEPKEDASPVLKAAPMVVARLAECQKEWCRLQIQAHKGWVRKGALWGVYPQEEIK